MWEFVGQAAVALVRLDFHIWAEAELLGVALGAYGSLVVHAARPRHAGEEGTALVIAECSRLDGVLLLLAGDERLTSGAPGLGTSDLDFRAIDAEVDVFGFGVGEDILQGPQAQAAPVGDGEATGREQRPDLADRSGDGGAVDIEQLGQGGMRKPEPQVDEGGQQPVGEDQLLLTARPSRPAPGTPRRSCNADSRTAVHLGASSWSKSPKCARETPDRAGWEQAVRAQVSFTTHLTHTALPRHGLI